MVVFGKRYKRTLHAAVLLITKSIDTLRMNHHTSGGFFVKCDSDWTTSMISFVLIAMT